MQIARLEVSKFGQITQVDQKWINLIALIKTIPFCEMTIRFRDGIPYDAEMIKENIKF